MLHALAAQQGTVGPISVSVNPPRGLVGTIFTIAGTSSGAGKVRITVTPEASGAAPITVFASPGTNGNFSVTFKEALVPGIYQAIAYAPDRASQAKTSFVVLTDQQTIQVKVSPTVTLQEQTCSGPAGPQPVVQITGTSDFTPPNRVVAILLSNGTSFHPQLDDAGNYVIQYTPTKAGTYQVRAISPNGTGRASSSFVVTKAPDSNAIQVQVLDSNPGIGDDITIRGSSPPDGSGPVTATITQPGGIQTAVSIPIGTDPNAAPNSSVNFAFCTNNTPVAGTYRVCVHSPGGHYNGSTTFDVASDRSPNPDPVLGQLALNFLNDIKNMNASLPVSPPQMELAQSIESLRHQFVEALSGMEGFNGKLEELLESRNGFPGEYELFAPVIADLKQWDFMASEAVAKYQQLLSRGNQSAVQCDNVDQIVKEIEALVGLVDLLRAKIQIVANYESDWKHRTSAAGQMPDDGLSTLRQVSSDDGLRLEDVPQCFAPADTQYSKPTNYGSFLQDVAQDDPGDAPIQYFNKVLDALHAVLQVTSDQAFAAYCAKFAGPFKASMTGTAIINGRPWWKSRIELQGTLTLRYDKRNSGSAIPISGEFEGVTTLLNTWENAFDVYYPKLHETAQLFHRTIQAVPGQPFRIAVTGQLTGNDLILTLQDAIVDYGAEVYAQVHYVVVSPFAIVPVFQEFPLPYKNAHDLLSRALGDNPVHLAITVGKKGMLITKTLTNQHTGPGSPGTAVGNYALNIKLCNPGCT
jgi:hypothetical protein